MAEITTCEHYVLARLDEVEKVNESLILKLQESAVECAEWKARCDCMVDLIKKSSEFSTLVDGTGAIKIDVWEKYDKELYTVFKSILDIPDNTLTYEVGETSND